MTLGSRKLHLDSGSVTHPCRPSLLPPSKMAVAPCVLQKAFVANTWAGCSGPLPERPPQLCCCWGQGAGSAMWLCALDQTGPKARNLRGPHQLSLRELQVPCWGHSSSGLAFLALLSARCQRCTLPAGPALKLGALARTEKANRAVSIFV